LDLRLGVGVVGAGILRHPAGQEAGVARVVGGAHLVAEVRPVPHEVDVEVPAVAVRRLRVGDDVIGVDDAAAGRIAVAVKGDRQGDVLGVVGGADVGLDAGVTDVVVAGVVGAGGRREAAGGLVVKGRLGVGPGGGRAVELEEGRVELPVDVVLFDVRQQ